MSPGSPEMLDTAEEFGVDPDVLIENYEDQDRREAEQQPPNRRVCTHSDGYCTSDSSLGVSEDDGHGWESDRSGHFY